MSRIIIHADMDAFYASVEQRDRPELRGKPVVVGAPRNKRGVVAAASYEARRFGIHSAMPSREAARLCPEAVFLPVNMARYEEVSGQIFNIFESFTPLVETLSLDEAFLDVTGARRLFGDGPAIAEKIRAKVRKETGLTVSAGVAVNKFLAKVASDMHKPDGLTIVPPDRRGILAFLAPLPVSRIWGVGKVTRLKFEKAGLKTIGDIQAVPESALARLVGDESAHFFKELADGRDDRAVEPVSIEKSISNEHTFEEDIDDRDEVWRTLLGLADNVGWRLRKSGMLASGVQIKIRWRGFQTITRQKKVRRPFSDDACLVETVRGLFEREKLIKPVRLVGVGVYGLIERAEISADLFDNIDTSYEKRARLSTAVDSIRGKFGRGSITRGRAGRSPSE